MSLDLAVAESPSQAQRVAKQVLQRRQYDRSFTAPFDIRAWKYPVGSVVPFTFPPLGFVRQIFRVAEQEIGAGGICNMTLSFETEEIYRWDAEDAAPVRAATAVVYDPTRSALIQAISDAASSEAVDAQAEIIAAQQEALATAQDTLAAQQQTLSTYDGRIRKLEAGEQEP